MEENIVFLPDGIPCIITMLFNKEKARLLSQAKECYITDFQMMS